MTAGPVNVKVLFSGLRVWLNAAIVPPGGTADAGGMLLVSVYSATIELPTVKLWEVEATRATCTGPLGRRARGW